MDIEFDYISLNTPQQNSFTKVDLFTTIIRGINVINRSNVPEEYLYVVFQYVIIPATKVDTLLVVDIK